MTEPSAPTVKTLFAHSGNTCAYRGCEEKMTDPAWKSVQGRVCHIRGGRPGAARYDEAMTDEQRHHYDNLILLCVKCHTKIDDLLPHEHPAELLLEMKQQHESRAAGTAAWTTDRELEQVVAIAMQVMRWEVRPGGTWGAGTWGGGSGPYGSGTYGEGTYGS